MIDFTNCKVLHNKAYSGANGKKISIEYEGKKYMLKFSPYAKDMTTNLSYTNSCYSEHIGSSIFNILGVQAQETILGIYVVGNQKKVVCACLDFTVDDKQLYDFCAIKNTVIDSAHGGTSTDLDDIMDTIQNQTFIDASLLSRHFWDMFVVDAFLGNFDRHNGNWGFLVDAKTGETTIAPIFDCGSCLLPQADDDILTQILANEDELNARIFTFPTSAIRQYGMKLNYYDFLTSTKIKDCYDSVNRIVSRIDLEQINEFIDNIDGINSLHKKFYKYYLEARYNNILVPAYEISMAKDGDTFLGR
ncbi:MAG: Serine/threonine-protein kinase CtkA [Firmicutes bacterium ADurb.Bin080]|mgnify:CR=1 FL=1|jgi:hypothetical protein|nr:CtkA family protein [Clostridiales bacterium]OQC14328.1 MAG: Serine/threonine-protein kinase CtkA [Firmicutes bacterium ADurb.Bin080]